MIFRKFGDDELDYVFSNCFRAGNWTRGVTDRDRYSIYGLFDEEVSSNRAMIQDRGLNIYGMWIFLFALDETQIGRYQEHFSREDRTDPTRRVVTPLYRNIDDIYLQARQHSHRIINGITTLPVPSQVTTWNGDVEGTVTYSDEPMTVTVEPRSSNEQDRMYANSLTDYMNRFNEITGVSRNTRSQTLEGLEDLVKPDRSRTCYFDNEETMRKRTDENGKPASYQAFVDMNPTPIIDISF